MSQAYQWYTLAPLTSTDLVALNRLVYELNTRFTDLSILLNDVPSANTTTQAPNLAQVQGLTDNLVANSTTAPPKVGNVSVVGTSTTAAHSDHTHQGVNLDTAQTITGSKTFNTGGTPFIIVGTTQVTNLNANLLQGLLSTAFAILAGQTGGQTLHGDTAASGNLTLSSTAHATKGQIIVQDELAHTGLKAGFFNHATATQQTVGAVTNNVTSGGSTGVIADITDGVIYANDYATIRADLYQLARSVNQIATALRAYGLGV